MAIRAYFQSLVGAITENPKRTMAAGYALVSMLAGAAGDIGGKSAVEEAQNPMMSNEKAQNAITVIGTVQKLFEGDFLGATCDAKGIGGILTQEIGGVLCHTADETQSASLIGNLIATPLIDDAKHFTGSEFAAEYKSIADREAEIFAPKSMQIAAKLTPETLNAMKKPPHLSEMQWGEFKSTINDVLSSIVAFRFAQNKYSEVFSKKSIDSPDLSETDKEGLRMEMIGYKRSGIISLNAADQIIGVAFGRNGGEDTERYLDAQLNQATAQAVNIASVQPVARTHTM